MKTAPPGTALYQVRFLAPKNFFATVVGGSPPPDFSHISFSDSIADFIFVSSVPNPPVSVSPTAGPAPSNTRPSTPPLARAAYAAVAASPASRMLCVVDAKSSPAVALSHKIQVALYGLMMNQLGLSVSPFGGVWIPAMATPSYFPVAPLQSVLADFFRHRMLPMLQPGKGANYEVQPWHMTSSCTTCPYYGPCRRERDEKKALGALPRASRAQVDWLRSWMRDSTQGVRDIEDTASELSQLSSLLRRPGYVANSPPVVRVQLDTILAIEYAPFGAALPEAVSSPFLDTVLGRSAAQPLLMRRTIEFPRKQDAAIFAAVMMHPRTNKVAVWSLRAVDSASRDLIPLQQGRDEPGLVEALGNALQRARATPRAGGTKTAPKPPRVALFVVDTHDRTILLDVLQRAVLSAGPQQITAARCLIALLDPQDAQRVMDLAVALPADALAAAAAHTGPPVLVPVLPTVGYLFALAQPVYHSLSETVLAVAPSDPICASAALQDTSADALYRLLQLAPQSEQHDQALTSAISARCQAVAVLVACIQSAAAPCLAADADPIEGPEVLALPQQPSTIFARLGLFASLDAAAAVLRMRSLRLPSLGVRALDEKAVVLKALSTINANATLMFEALLGATSLEEDDTTLATWLLAPLRTGNTRESASVVEFNDNPYVDATYFNKYLRIELAWAAVKNVERQPGGSVRVTLAVSLCAGLPALEEGALYVMTKRTTNFNTPKVLAALREPSPVLNTLLLGPLPWSVQNPDPLPLVTGGAPVPSTPTTPSSSVDSLALSLSELSVGSASSASTEPVAETKPKRGRPRKSEVSSLSPAAAPPKTTPSAGASSTPTNFPALSSAVETIAALPLTPSQNDALEAIKARHVTVLWGPPGSGKTHFAASMLLRLLAEQREARRPLRVVVTAFTRTALDNLLNKIHALLRVAPAIPRTALVRITSAGEALPDGLAYEQISTKDAKAMQRKLDLVTSTHRETGWIMGGTVWQLQKCVGKSELQADLLLIDEASQMKIGDVAVVLGVLPECENGAPDSRRLVVIGDHLQMPPLYQATLPSPPANGEQPVHLSLLQHLRLALDRPEGRPCLVKLKENHRMCSALAAFTQTLYESNYVVCQCCNSRRQAPLLELASLPAESIEARILAPNRELVVVVLPPCPTQQELTQRESALVGSLVRAYVRARVQAGASEEAAADSLFVVTPHHAQRRQINQEIGAQFRVLADTVERMQGQERSTVLVCLSFSAQQLATETEFLFNRNRLNVALSRAQHKAIVICTSEVLQPTEGRIAETEEGTNALAYLDALRRFAEGRNSVFELAQ
eukprot:TRINITY_DN4467_c0_g1_i1.p1 TRINITY_DN4467_c0_g1~~TRINITY_DN4467_c0_g1_i1.p1  ORF type:complete len:1374 (+),score=260.14 TRINITY_DN4467_c0_g1_i1:176-4123(+)